MTKSVFVVAGNGASLADDVDGRILASDRFVRTNNFFFEPQSYLGRRIDLAVMGGDPRVAPFMFETLWQCRSTYDLRAWTSHNPRVIRAGQRRFKAQHAAFPDLPDHLKSQITDLIDQFRCKPMTGTYAVLGAFGMGARTIILTGFDFYQSGKRYAYDAGPHQSSLLGADLNTRSIDSSQHNLDLDLAIFELLQKETRGGLFRMGSNMAIADLMDVAPQREGHPPEVGATSAPSDWASWAGLYPMAALKLMRRVRASVAR